jgi:2-oxoisovalerate dehydrogenase E1 component beta subunit
MVVRMPYGGGVRGGLYHSQSVEVIFAHQPGLQVVTPATPYDAKGLLKTAIRSDDPVVFLEHKRTYRLVRGDVPDTEYTLPIGKADVKLEGDDLTAVTYGLMVHYTLEAARALAEEDVNVEVVDLRTLSPLDRETVLDSVRKTSKVMVIHEDSMSYGIGAEIAATIASEAFEDLDAPVMRVTGPDLPGMPYSPLLEAEYMPSAEKIAIAMRELAAY